MWASIDAVADGQIDVAVVWGPFAGYFAKQEKVPLDIVPVSPAMFLTIPFTYVISAGVRKNDKELLVRIERAIASDSVAIRQILDSYGVPQPNGE